jgi:hypothetical protein
MTIDQAGFGQEFQMPRDARLRLTENRGQILDGELAFPEQGEYPQPGPLARGSERRNSCIEGQGALHWATIE